MRLKMISENSLREISSIFCGDTKDLEDLPFYSYKSGSSLVAFFNQYYKKNDQYGAGFPSRWKYVHDYLLDLEKINEIEAFLNIILKLEYILVDLKLSKVEAAKQQLKIINKFNLILKNDYNNIIQKENKFIMISENEDLIFIEKGGFANVYKQKSTGLVVKKLKDDFLHDDSIRSRFKREFNITQQLQSIDGIIKVCSFDEASYSYTMEFADQTYEEYIKEKELTLSEKTSHLTQIFHIISEVHKTGTIHRDLSPNNIFIKNNKIIIADFGLGKNLRSVTSHQTHNTAEYGQYNYCAPEQIQALKDGDARSDVFSLGRIFNFTMTKNPHSSAHEYKNITAKATNENPQHRYADASELLREFNKTIDFLSKKNMDDEIFKQMSQSVFNSEIEVYLFAIEHFKLCKILTTSTHNCFIQFMRKNPANAQYLIESIENNYKDFCEKEFSRSGYSVWDSFAIFANKVIKENFETVQKELAANILSYVAHDKNRYFAQDLVNLLLVSDIDYTIKEILRA